MSDFDNLLCFGEPLESLKAVSKSRYWRVSWPKSRGALMKALAHQRPSAVTMSFKRPSPYLGIAEEVIHRTHGDMPVFLVVDPAVTEDLNFARIVAGGNVDYALAQSAPAEVMQRLRVLLRSHPAENPEESSSRLPGENSVTAGLYDDSSHRLNARKVADFFGLTLRQFAGLLRALPQSVHKTPDAVRLQERLSVFERIARGLALVDNEKSFRRWLNAPNRELGNQSPLEVIKSGKAEVVASLVEDALLGQPA